VVFLFRNVVAWEKLTWFTEQDFFLAGIDVEIKEISDLDRLIRVLDRRLF
jgi:hypothetical protein